MNGGKENTPPGGENLPDPVSDKSTEIINQIISQNRWGSVEGSTVIPQENNMWELRIHFNNGTTRRVRIGGDGGVTSDNTEPTRTLR